MFLGIFITFLGEFFIVLSGGFFIGKIGKDFIMKKKNYKGRCVKRAVPKSKEICKTYNDIQFKFLDVLQESEQVKLRMHYSSQ